MVSLVRLVRLVWPQVGVTVVGEWMKISAAVSVSFEAFWIYWQIFDCGVVVLAVGIKIVTHLDQGVWS